MRPQSSLRLPTAALLVPGLFACGGGAPPEPAPAPEVAPAPAAIAPTVITRTDTVVVRDTALDARASRLELQLAERDAQLEALGDQLDDTRREVVQTLAKLRNSATRAEAASAIAEAEIAVQGMPTIGSTELAGDRTQARSLLAQSDTAFGAQNYGGARYLAILSKATAASVQARASVLERGGRRPGERLFAAPVRFVVASRANLREGPRTGARVLATLERGEELTATSYVGDWLRVTDRAGREGWIFQELVSRD